MTVRLFQRVLHLSMFIGEPVRRAALAFANDMSAPAAIEIHVEVRRPYFLRGRFQPSPATGYSTGRAWYTAQAPARPARQALDKSRRGYEAVPMGENSPRDCHLNAAMQHASRIEAFPS